MPRKSKTRVQHSPFETVNIEAAEASAFRSTLLELPLELIIEILSHFNCLPLITGKLDYGLFGIDPTVTRRYLERTDTLRALSQTCRSWRNRFFPLLWDRLEPCLIHSSDSGIWSESYGTSLIRKSALVCENPEIASYIRSMSVTLPHYSTETVLPACVQAIEALPNLHTLQIVRMDHKMSTLLKNALKGHTFPQIRTISLPSRAHHILRRCPEVRKVICISRRKSSTLVSAIASHCKKVEEIQGIRGSMEKLAKAAPNLRSIKFDYPIPSFDLQHFSSLKNLAHITLFTYQAADEQAMMDDKVLACIKLAKDIVRKAPGRGSVTIEHHGVLYNQDLDPSPAPKWSRAFSVER